MNISHRVVAVTVPVTVGVTVTAAIIATSQTGSDVKALFSSFPLGSLREASGNGKLGNALKVVRLLSFFFVGVVELKI